MEHRAKDLLLQAAGRLHGAKALIHRSIMESDDRAAFELLSAAQVECHAALHVMDSMLEELTSKKAEAAKSG